MSEEEIKDINEEVADIAEAILRVAALGEALDNSHLKRTTIKLLIKHQTNLPMYEIDQVLNALPKLKEYVK